MGFNLCWSRPRVTPALTCHLVWTLALRCWQRMQDLQFPGTRLPPIFGSTRIPTSRNHAVRFAPYKIEVDLARVCSSRSIHIIAHSLIEVIGTAGWSVAKSSGDTLQAVNQKTPFWKPIHWELQSPKSTMTPAEWHIYKSVFKWRPSW